MIVLRQLIKNKSANKGLFTVIQSKQEDPPPHPPTPLLKQVKNSLPSLNTNPSRQKQHSGEAPVSSHCFVLFFRYSMQVHLIKSLTRSPAHLPGVLDSFSIQLLTFTQPLSPRSSHPPYPLRGGAREASTLTAEAGLFFIMLLP